MTTQARLTLYNCLTDCDPDTIDWRQVSWLEVGGCTTTTLESGETWTDGGLSDEEAQFWTVYSRYNPHSGFAELEAVTDCKTRLEADLVAIGLGAIHSLKVEA